MELKELKGLGPKRLKDLHEAGISGLEDLIWQLPRGYVDSTQPMPTAALRPGQMACIRVRLVQAPRIQYVRGLSIVRAQGADDSGTVNLIWFNQPWTKGQLQTGEELLLYGKVERYKAALSLQNPRRLNREGILPRYAPVGSVPGKLMGELIAQALPLAEQVCPETMPAGLRELWQITDLHSALRQAHVPENREGLQAAQRRLAFENLLLYQLALQTLHSRDAQGPLVPTDKERTELFWRQTGFAPTQAQHSALETILSDLGSGRAMRRLVQGDVGSGKTAVAFGAVLAARDAGLQSALMVPTEILARQHLQSAQALLEPLGVRCGLLLGGMKAAERREALQHIAEGTWDLVIGTQALFSAGVKYGDLGLVITDEQHRFGVKQRQRLSDKAEELEAHVLVMSATPIPRTLALLLYGDLDVSLIDQMPPGREPVKTRIVPEEKRDEMYRFLVQKVGQGEQAYLVCPLVEESEQVEAKDAQQVYDALRKGPLKSLRLGLTWGSQPTEEKEATIAAFSRAEIDVLIATTVIEVGVNVPRATVMVIEDAERFGLSQLHQLRGRVGRGGGESWCFLMGDRTERLQTLCQSNDGFFIAQKDLEMRGPGDFLGTRQSGRLLPDAFGVQDMRLIEETRQAAETIADDPMLRGAAEGLIHRAQEKYAPALREIALH